MAKRWKAPSPIAEILQATIAKWNLGPSLSRYNVMAEWETIAGATLAAKSRPLRFQKEWLLVEVDHPTWIQELNLLKTQFLAKIAKRFPEAGIRRIRFVLKGGRNESP